MAVTDKKMDRNGNTAVKTAAFPLALTVSKTNRPYAVIRPGYDFVLKAVRLFCTAYTATVSLTVYLLDKLNAFITAPTLATDAVATKWKTGAFVARIAGTFVESAALTAQTFTAAHVVTKNLWGIILFQMDATGAVSTKVPAATQAYTSAAAALAGLPAPDADHVALGYAILQAAALTDWTANTSDLTPASGVQSVAYTDSTAATAALSAAVTPTALKEVEGTLQTTVADIKGAATEDIVIVGTTDGTAVLTNGVIAVDYRPDHLNGEG